MKKASVILSSALILGLLAGCGNNTDNAAALLTHQLKQLLLQQIPVTLELKLDSTKTEFTTVLLTLMLKLAGNISHS